MSDNMALSANYTTASSWSDDRAAGQLWEQPMAGQTTAQHGHERKDTKQRPTDGDAKASNQTTEQTTSAAVVTTTCWSKI